MNATNRTPLLIAFAVVAVLFLLFGLGAMTGTMMNGGWMGTGWMGGNGKCRVCAGLGKRY